MDTDFDVRRRAPRKDILARRAERAVAAPLASKLIGWHEATAKLAARAAHISLHGKPHGSLPDDVDALSVAIKDELVAWRGSLGEFANASRVADADKSARVILDKLARLRKTLPSPTAPRTE